MGSAQGQDAGLSSAAAICSQGTSFCAGSLARHCKASRIPRLLAVPCGSYSVLQPAGTVPFSQSLVNQGCPSRGISGLAVVSCARKDVLLSQVSCSYACPRMGLLRSSLLSQLFGDHCGLYDGAAGSLEGQVQWGAP